MPTASDYKTIQERIANPLETTLRPFDPDAAAAGLPFTLQDYLELVDWAGRAIQRGKRGHIPTSTPPIMVRLNMQSSPVLAYLQHSEKFTPVALGPVSALRKFAHAMGRRFVKGLSLGKSICPEGF